MNKNDELQRMLKRGFFKVLSHHLPGRTEENHDKLGEFSGSFVRDLNLGSRDYKVTLHPDVSSLSIRDLCFGYFTTLFQMRKLRT
jgi:hypothetical protein